MDFIYSIPAFWLAVISSLCCWLFTALGALIVVFFKKVNATVMNILMGFSAGVMIAASFWSLLSPAIEMGTALGYIPWLFPAIGFVLGGGFVLGAAKLLDGAADTEKCGVDKSRKRGILLVASITLHNIPEGMSVGVAFGAIAVASNSSAVIGALTLALGIALQNFPEGAAVSLPLRRDGMSRLKAFTLGQLSGIVEPCATVLGYLLCTVVKAALPFCLSFSAGAMIAVAASELIPEGCGANKYLASLGCIAGFTVMMLLDVALG